LNENLEPVISYPAGKYSVLRVLPHDPYTRKLFPEVVQRAIRFIDHSHSDVDPIWLGQHLYGHFHQRTNYIHLLVAVDNAVIVAHSISYVDVNHNLGNHVVVLQLEKDIPDGNEIVDVGLRLIDEWARGLGLKTIVNCTDSAARVRYFERYGFKPARTILHRVVPDDVAEVVNG
jgi:hypothetical protein